MPKVLVLPDDLNDDLREILGMPNFVCAPYAHAMRDLGADIPRKAEAEQAAVLFALLEFYADAGSGWRGRAAAWTNELVERARNKRAMELSVREAQAAVIIKPLPVSKSDVEALREGE